MVKIGNTLSNKEQNFEWNKKRLNIKQKNNIIMSIINTAFSVIYAGPEAKVYNCANIELIELIGSDPQPIDTIKERSASFQGDVRFYVKTHKYKNAQFKEQKGLFWIKFNSLNFNLKSQENIKPLYIKTNQKKYYMQAQLPKAFY